MTGGKRVLVRGWEGGGVQLGKGYLEGGGGRVVFVK